MVILWGALLTIHAIDDAATFIFCVNYKIFHLQDLSSDSLLLQTFTNIRRFRKLVAAKFILHALSGKLQ
jgi:hypothetical protein